MDHGTNAAAREAEQATVALYEEFGAALVRYAGQLAGSPDEARDAVQEVFLRFFVERRYGRSIANPRAWLYRVLRNYLLDRLKAAASQREIQTADFETLAVQGRDNPEEMVQRSQAARQIAQTLSDRECTCLTLRGEGLSYAEIAEVMEIQTGTVGALLSRAQIKLYRYGQDEKKNVRAVAEALLCLVQEGLTYSTS